MNTDKPAKKYIFTRTLLIIYLLFCFGYLINFWNEFRRDDTGGIIFVIFWPILIIFVFLLLFGLFQDVYAAIIMNNMRLKAWEHSFVGTIFATVPLAVAMWWDFEWYLGNNFRALIVPSIWVLLTVLLFWRIAKLRKE